MSQLRLQVRIPDGKPLRLSLPLSTTYEELVATILQEKPELGEIVIHTGFPPKEVSSANPSAPVTSLGVKSGTTLNVELAESAGTVIQGSGWDLPSTVDPVRGRMVHYRVPGDNSCFFHSIGAALMRTNPSKQMVLSIKDTIAQEIRNNPNEWNAAVLGMSPQAYITQLQQPSFWGGAIETSILSLKYQIEICVVDFAQLSISTFAHYSSQDKPDADMYTRRVFLFYDSSENSAHYDLLVYTPDSGRASALSGMQASAAEDTTTTSFDSHLQSIFRPQDQGAITLVKSIAELYHERLVRQGKATKREWTQKVKIQGKQREIKPKFQGASGVLGETLNMGDHLSLAPQTVSTNPSASTTSTTSTAPKPTPTVKPAVATTTKPAATASAATNKQDWSCPVCTCTNSYARTICEACESPRPRVTTTTTTSTAAPKVTAASPPSATTTRRGNPAASTAASVRGDWSCPQCTYLNAGHDSQCDICSCDRPAAGATKANKATAKTSKSTKTTTTSTTAAATNDKTNSSANEEQWTCSCGCDNPSSASHCQRCQAKNPNSECVIM